MLLTVDQSINHSCTIMHSAQPSTRVDEHFDPSTRVGGNTTLVVKRTVHRSNYRP